MDELEISGKKYISSRRAGKEHKYHPDYIGQLVRAGKIAGQKIGRSWYVDAESLSAYFNKEPQLHSPVQKEEKPVAHIDEPIAVETFTEEKEAEAPIEIKEEAKEEKKEETIEKAVEVEDTTPETHIAVKIFQPVEEKKITVLERISRGGLRYLPDDEPLFPAFTTKKNVPARAEVEVRVNQKAATMLREEPGVKLIPRTVKNKRTSVRPLLFSAFAGLLVLGAVLGGSYVFKYVQTVKDSKLTAGVTFSFGE